MTMVPCNGDLRIILTLAAENVILESIKWIELQDKLSSSTIVFK